MKITERLPPHSKEAEEAVLGSIIIDPDCFMDLDFLKPEMFYHGRWGWVLSAIQSLIDQGYPIDFVTISEKLQSNGKLEKIEGGESSLVGLINAVPTAINAVHYGRIVQANYLKRQMIQAASEIANLAWAEDDIEIDDLIAQGQHLMGDVAAQSNNNKAIHISELMSIGMDHVQNQGDSEFTGITTGFTDLDKILGGLQNGDLITIGARPGMGKTALLNDIRLAAAKAGYKVGSFDMEMNALQNSLRILSSESRIDSQKLRRGNLTELEEPRFMQAAGELSMLNIYVDVAPSQTIDSLVSRSRFMYFNYGIQLLLVDYTQLIRSSGRNRHEEVSEVIRRLKELARELDIPIIAAAQLNRSLESRQDKRPILADLKESGAIEEHSDVVIFIYRDEVYNPDTTERPNIAEILIAKHRNGPTGAVDLYWQGKYSSFRNLQRQQINLGDPPNIWENKAAYDAEQMEL